MGTGKNSGFTFSFDTFPSAYKGLSYPEHRANAAFFGYSLLEEARIAGFSNVTLRSGKITLTGQDNSASYSLREFQKRYPLFQTNNSPLHAMEQDILANQIPLVRRHFYEKNICS